MKALNFVITALVVAPCSLGANDFPTVDRVDNVLTCMKKHGGQTVDNLYSCSCAIDVIASMMSYEDWSEALTFRSFRRMPGEKGGIFRDSERGEQMLARLDQAEQEADRRCFIGVSRASRAK